MGRSLVVDWQHTRKRLFILYRREQDVAQRTRLQALMLLRQGKGLREVADTVGADYRTVQRWVAWYRAGGLAEVARHRLGGQGGPVRRLSPAQEAALKAKAAAGALRSIQDGVHWAAQQGVAYTYWGMRWVFARLDLAPKVPRPRNPQASPAAQAAWKKKGLRQALEKAGVRGVAGLGWADEMRVGLIGQVRRVWAPRGVKVVQLQEYVHEWTYLLLVVNPLRGTLRWAWVPDMKGASLAPVLRTWAQRGLRTVVWDGARGHRGAAYAGLKLRRIEQPPYSPELNPVERIFEHLRARVEGKVYGTITAKRAALDIELQRLAACPPQVKSLTGWDWICHALQNFQKNSRREI